MMGFEESISYIENSILSGRLSFFVTSTLGRIAVEVPDEFDEMHPISVTYWREAPRTRWCMRHSNANADIYVSIGVLCGKESRTFVHLKVIEAMHRCFFLKCLGVDIGEDVADASTIAYLRNIEERSITENYIEQEFCKIHFNPFVRIDDMVRNMVKDMICRRTEAAMKVMKHGEMIISMSTNYVTFVTTYNRDIFTVICYIIGDVEDPRIANRNNFTSICQKAVEYLAGY